VQAKAAEVGKDPEKLFAFVRDGIAYEVYPGVLRGAKGTLLGRAGNAPDKSLLLAELLKARGWAVRFAFGTLDDGKAQELVRKMFQRDHAVRQGKLDEAFLKSLANSPESDAHHLHEYRATQEALAGLLKGVEEDCRFIDQALQSGKASVGGQPELRSLAEEAQQHTWVQYERDGKWIDLDPSIGGAKVGECFAQPSTVQPAIPDRLYQRVTFRVKVEQKDGKKLETRTVLETTHAAADLVGVSIVCVNVPGIPGMQFTPADLEKAAKFLPLILVNGKSIYQSGFDLSGNVLSAAEFSRGLPGGLSSALGGIGAALEKGTDLSGEPNKPIPALTGQWLEFTLTAPGTPTRVVVREIVDRIGIENRVGDGEKVIKTDWRDEKRLRYALAGRQEILIDPGSLSEPFALNQLLSQLTARKGALEALLKENSSPEKTKPPAKPAVQPGSTLSGELLSLSCATSALGERLVGTGSRDITFYRATPGIAVFKTRLDTAPGGKVMVRQGFDIVEPTFRVVAADDPGKARRLALALGALQTRLERALALQFSEAGTRHLDQQAPDQVRGLVNTLNTIDVFDAARRAAVKTAFLNAAQAKDVSGLRISAEAKERIRQDLAKGYVVLVPEKNVLLGGRQTIGWWRIDPRTGCALGMMESGEGALTIEYLLNQVGGMMILAQYWMAENVMDLAVFCVAGMVLAALSPDDTVATVGGGLALVSCGLLDYALALRAAIQQRAARARELAKDPAHGNAVTPKSEREAQVALALEERGGAEGLPGPIRRDPSGKADFIDSSGQKWDVKTPNTNFPPDRGGSTLAKTLADIEAEFMRGENVILDTKDMSADFLQQLRKAIEDRGWGARIRWYP
jgi:hypothetical protein